MADSSGHSEPGASSEAGRDHPLPECRSASSLLAQSRPVDGRALVERANWDAWPVTFPGDRQIVTRLGAARRRGAAAS
jgi:hypothetical protein